MTGFGGKWAWFKKAPPFLLRAEEIGAKSGFFS